MGPAGNGSGQEASKRPPWADVPAEALVGQLQMQLAGQAMEMAAMRAYIDQLHQALALAAAQAPVAPVVAD